MDARALAPQRPGGLQAEPINDAVLEIDTPAGRREVAYAEWGDLDGAPVVLLWGAPNSRLYCCQGTTPARIITMSRPGYGKSSPSPGATLLDVASDVGQLADALGIDRFALVGYSAGVPHAAASAVRLGDRVTRLALVSGPGPQPRPGGFVSTNPAFPELCRMAQADRAAAAEAVAGFATIWTADPLSFMVVERTPAVDRWLLDDRSVLDRGLRDAFAAGSGGFAWDLVRLLAPWGFALGDVAVPTTVFAGSVDHLVPIVEAEAQADAIPGAELVVWADEGHFGFLRRWDDVAARCLPT